MKDMCTPHTVYCIIFTPKNMARKKSKKKKKIKFELTLGGILGVGAVLFCVFLWMFLLGIWTGQTVLLPPG
jgi:hypothetical protein